MNDSMKASPITILPRRGMTLLELALATVITVLVAGGIAGMLGAVSSGVGTRKDNRDVMVRAHAAQSRLAAYVATSKCVLAAGPDSITLWLNDSRESATVHATEIRWIRFDPGSNELIVEFVQFPDAWTPTACELADHEFSKNQDWTTVRTYYHGKNLLEHRAIVDLLASAAVHLSSGDAMSARQVVFELGFESNELDVVVQASGAIQAHEVPIK